MPRRLALSMMVIAAASLLVLPGCRGFLTYRIAEAPGAQESRPASTAVQQQAIEPEARPPMDLADQAKPAEYSGSF